MTIEIIPHKGYGGLLFDMPVEEIVKILGEPDEVESMDAMDDYPTTMLHYDGMTLFCDGQNPTLSCIDIYNPDATLFGKRVFEMKEKELVALMVSNGYYEQDVDNEAWGERRISFGEGNIDFFLEKDKLITVNIGK